jgi:hypothetical protein
MREGVAGGSSCRSCETDLSFDASIQTLSLTLPPPLSIGLPELNLRHIYSTSQVNDVCVRKYSLGWTVLDCFTRTNVTDLGTVNLRAYHVTYVIHFFVRLLGWER